MGAYLIYTTQKYDSYNFGDKPISDIALSYFLSGNIDKIQEVSFQINKNDLVIDKSMYNMLADSTMRTFYSVTISPMQVSFTWPKTDVHMRIMFTLCLDHVTNTRNTYNLV